MHIAIVQNNTIVKHGTHKRMFPNVSFPSTGPSIEWLENNSAKVVNTTKELANDNVKLVNVDPYIDTDGNVYCVRVETFSSEESEENLDVKKVNMRNSRDAMLRASDWTQMSDSPLSSSKKTEWATYRQTLRDLPSDSNWPNISFPDQPS